MKALDLLRTLGWTIVNFIYSMIDGLFDILKEINALDIVNSISEQNAFQKLYSGIFAIALTLLGLFSVWTFVKKVLDPDEGMSIEQIVKEIIKCGILIIMSTFMFVQCSNFSITLSNYTANSFSDKNISLSDSMLVNYVGFTDAYKVSDDFKNEDYKKAIENDTFTKKKMYKDKFVTDSHFILPDEKEYKYDINWIMAIIVGGFFLYALFFSGMMLARRQIEFLFLFVISPIILATSVGNKERRSALFQQLVSLILQGAVVMLIIILTVMLMKAIQSTTFFNSAVKDTIIKSILYIGCGTFLLTGSQTVNRFIGGNVSANSGREQLMSMMGFGNAVKTGAVAGGLGATGAGLVGAGALTSAAGKLGGNKLVQNIGKGISNFGKNISNKSPIGSPKSSIGNAISKFGNKVSSMTPSSLGKSMRTSGYRGIGDAISTMDPTKNIYRRRYSRRQ
jgi:hypothetical protein